MGWLGFWVSLVSPKNVKWPFTHRGERAIYCTATYTMLPLCNQILNLTGYDCAQAPADPRRLRQLGTGGN